MVEKSTRKKIFFDDSGSVKLDPNSKGKVRRVGTKKLASVIKTEDECFLSFVDG